jgi:hypothetical protein
MTKLTYIVKPFYTGRIEVVATFIELWQAAAGSFRIDCHCATHSHYNGYGQHDDPDSSHVIIV